MLGWNRVDFFRSAMVRVRTGSAEAHKPLFKKPGLHIVPCFMSVFPVWVFHFAAAACRGGHTFPFRQAVSLERTETAVRVAPTFDCACGLPLLACRKSVRLPHHTASNETRSAHSPIQRAPSAHTARHAFKNVSLFRDIRHHPLSRKGWR
jgi:hypothetical protein